MNAPTLEDIRRRSYGPEVGTLQLRIQVQSRGTFKVGVYSALGFDLEAAQEFTNIRLASAWGAYAMGLMTEHIDRHIGAHRA